MRRILPVITAVLLGMVACSANSSGSFLLLSVNNWKAIQTDVSSNHLDPKKTLVVLDDDNTLLRSSGYLGSAQWFNDQYAAIEGHANHGSNVQPMVKDLPTFMALNNFVLSLVPKKLSDNQLPAIIKGWQKQGYSVMVVTSRNPAVRFSTLRGLANHGIYIKGNMIAKQPSDARVLYLDDAHKHGFMHGILFTTGGNKAQILQQFFKQYRPVRSFTNYVVVDDTKSILSQFKTWFDQQSAVTGLYTYWYNNEPTYSAADKAKALAVSPSVLTVFKRFGSKGRVY